MFIEAKYASQLWCPFSRVAVEDDLTPDGKNKVQLSNAVSVNRCASDDHNTSGTGCKAQDCMAWKFRHTERNANLYEEHKDESMEGYCSLMHDDSDLMDRDLGINRHG